MGTLAVIVCGIIGTVSAARKNFVPCWIFLVNLSFSLYLAIFLSPLVIPLLDIPGLSAGCRNAIAAGALFILLEVALTKIADQVVPNPDENMPLPALPAKIISLCAGFFSGALIAALILFCLVQTGAAANADFRKNCRDASGKTILILVQTMDILSGQWRDSAKAPAMRLLGITADDSEAAPPAAADGKAGKTPADAKAGKAGPAEGKKDARPGTKRSRNRSNRQ